MKLSELVAHQHDWEEERGINNGRYNLNRIMVELQEAIEADGAEEVMEELIDVFIIAAGGLARTCEELGLGFDEVDNLLVKKLSTNHVKYHKHFFSGADPAEAQERARHYWSHGFWEGNECY